MNKLIALIIFSLVFSFGVISQAKTPDGKTPSEETACAGLDGKAFGQCNAFCEAKDCDSFDPSEWNKSCFNILDHYQDATGFAGPPCFCEGACGLELQECLAECDPNDVCCPVDCRNDRNRCVTRCCSQQQQLDTIVCLENCDDDPEVCAIKCQPSFCLGLLEGCIITPVPVPFP